MVLVMMTLLAQLTMAETTIQYNDAYWDANAEKVVTVKRSREMTALSSSNDWVGVGNGWYYVSGNVSCKTLNIMGNDVNLVLCDGATLTCTGGVKLESVYRKLTIYSQSTGANEGKLVVTQSYSGAAGIGCAENCEDDYGNPIGMGYLVIYGGDITAIGSTRGAAIGGGKNRGISGTVTIYGGKVKALKGSEHQQLAAGIGGGWGGGQGGAIYIYGGEVTAEGKGYGEEGGAGIGGGGGSRSEGGEGGLVCIYGGTVKATSEPAGGGAAIGGGSKHTFDRINISGGTVIAEAQQAYVNSTLVTNMAAAIGAGDDSSQHGGIINISGGVVMAKAVEGAGIGGGSSGNGGQVNISGGHVIATSVEGAGIGGGYKGSGGNVTVSGGNVTAYSSQNGAGIGGGNKGNGGALNVTGGYVTAVGGTITIDWFKDHTPAFTAWKDNPNGSLSVALDYLGWIIVGIVKSGTYYGAGVGGGDKGSGGSVNVTGGTLHALGGTTEAPGIGGGRKGESKGSLEFGDNMMVFTSETNTYANYRTTDRKALAHSQYNVYISEKHVPLSSYGSNTATINALNGQTKSVILTWRTYMCGGQYNTICLPFSLSDLKDTPLNGAAIYTVKSSKIENKILVLELQEAAQRIEAGVPYVVRWPKPADYDKNADNYDIQTIVFDDVTIDNTVAKSVETDNGTFSGAYDNVVFTSEDMAQVVFTEDGYGTPAYMDYSLGALAANFKGKDSSKFGWEKGNYEQIMFSLNGVKDTGASVHYITHTWDAATGTLEQFDCICPKVEYITGNKPDDWYALNQNQWYVTSGSDVRRKAIEVHDNAYLILHDNSTLTLTGGLKVESGKQLRIYGQSVDTENTGKLNITQSYSRTAALGGAEGNPIGSVSIHSGAITATGTDNCAAIGPGRGYIDFEDGGYTNNTFWWKPEKSFVDIYGGKVTAQGGKNAAGIGSSYESTNVKVNIYGGTVNATGGEDAAGIGGAYDTDNYGEIAIYGGTVEATAGSGCSARNAKKGSAIGAGSSVSEKNTNLTLGKGAVNLKVTAGDAANNIERVFTSGERVDACHWRNYAKVEPCSHTDADALSYNIIDDISHQARCKYCGYDAKEPHLYDATTRKCACGRVEDAQPETWTVSFYIAKDAKSTVYDEPYKFRVVKGEKLPIPAYDTPEGLVFMQWMVNPETAPTSYEMKDNEYREQDVYIEGYELWPSFDLNLYARYRYGADEKWTWNASGASADVSASVEVTLGNGEKTGTMDAVIDHQYYEADGDLPACTMYIAKVSYERAEGITYTFSDAIERNALDELVIVDGESNVEKIDKNNYAQFNHVKLEGRTLYRDGTWNTLVLPFDVNIAGSALDGEGVEVRELETSTYFTATNTLRMEFSEPQQTMRAGVPYIIKWSNTNSGNIVEPTFSNVIINAERSNMETNNVDFIGCYAPVTLKANDKMRRYIGANNKIFWPAADVTINSCRAYFKLKGIDTSASSADALLMDFDTSRKPTGINIIDPKSGTSGQMLIDGVTYDLQGRMAVQGHLPQGMYVVNGKKVVNK